MPAGDLPYGVQKMVGVARALALDPKLLLLDEPSTGLMREEKENFARYLLRIRHELKLTVLWVEHDMQMVTDLADRIVVLNYGEVIADGVPECRAQDAEGDRGLLGSGVGRAAFAPIAISSRAARSPASKARAACV